MEEQRKNMRDSHPIELNGNDLNINDLYQIAYENKTVNRFFVGGMILALILFTIVMDERGSANY